MLHQAADNNPCVWNKEIAKLLGLFVIFSLLQLKSGCSRFQNPLKPILVTVCSLLCLWPWAKACGTAGRVKSYHSSSVRAALGLKSFRLKCIYFNSFGLGGSFLPRRYNSDQRASFVCHAEDPHLSRCHHLVPVFVNIPFPVVLTSLSWFLPLSQSCSSVLVALEPDISRFRGRLGALLGNNWSSGLIVYPAFWGAISFKNKWSYLTTRAWNWRKNFYLYDGGVHGRKSNLSCHRIRFYTWLLVELWRNSTCVFVGQQFSSPVTSCLDPEQ